MSEVTDSLIEIEVQNGLRDHQTINKYESQRIVAKTPKSSCPDSSLCLTEFPSWHNIWTKMQVLRKALQWNPSLSCKDSWPWKAACSCWATVQKMQVPWPLHSRWDQKLQPRWNQIHQPDLRSLFRLLCWPPWRWSCRWTSQGSNKILKWRKETHSISSFFPIYSNLKVTFKMTNDCTQPFIKTWINFTSEHILVLFGGWVLVIGAGAGSIVSVLSAVGHH